jgi:XTP/dITP diphosphohydrolase
VDALRARLASGNEHKLRELRTALPGWDVRLLDGVAFPPEEGDTYAENARAKALFGRRFAAGGEWVLGEDSGIEVDALGGRPGVQSARWARGQHVERLLAALEAGGDRRARYVCELVAVAPDGTEVAGRGVLEGEIARESRGAEGFGFDPVFVPDGETRTSAELDPAEKDAASHRGRAMRALLPHLHALT